MIHMIRMVLKFLFVFHSCVDTPFIPLRDSINCVGCTIQMLYCMGHSSSLPLSSICIIICSFFFFYILSEFRVFAFFFFFFSMYDSLNWCKVADFLLLITVSCWDFIRSSYIRKNNLFFLARKNNLFVTSQPSTHPFSRAPSDFG